MRGIDAAAVYVPRFRLSAEAVKTAWGITPSAESVAVPAADEDAFTMALGAAERLFERHDADREAVERICIGTTTPPLEEGMVAPRLGRALGLSSVETGEFTQSTLAGAEALAGALNADGRTLVAVADCPVGDPAEADGAFGAGAVAFLVTDDARVGCVDRAWHTEEYPGIRFRERGDERVDELGVTTYARDATRECVTAAVSNLAVGVEDLRAAALHQPDGRMPGRIARGLSLDAEVLERGTVVGQIGDAGAATIPLGMARALALAEPDDRTLAGFFGSGGAGAAFVFEGALRVADLDDGEFVPGVELSYPEYLRERGTIVSKDVAGGGAYVSVPNWRRTLDQRYRLVAGRCPNCESLTFPPEGACQSCHARVEFDRVELPRVGTVEASTVIGQGGAPPEFAAHQHRDGPYGVAIVEIEAANGGRVTLPAQLTDAEPTAVEVGDTVRAVVRRIYEQEGVTRYGVKFTPVA